MKFKSQIATLAGRTSQQLLKKFTSGGTSLPGKIAQRIDPDILKALGENYRVVIITGTNGKTVTTALTVNILKQAYDHVMTNNSGSNMLQGITSSFIEDSGKKSDKKIAVLEVDEASLRHITEHIKPEVILTTNIFRDQMDRYGEIYTTYDFILQGAAKAPNAILLQNGDAPIFASREVANPQIFFGFDNKDQSRDFLADNNTDGVICPNCEHVLHYHDITYSNLGDYFCPNCGVHRPELTYKVDHVDALTPESATFTIDGYQYEIPVAGLYNVYNALAAYSLGRYFGISQEDIAKGLQSAKRIFGRQEAINVDGHDLRINLIKNPVGLNQIIELTLLEKAPFTLITVLNDRPADGQDVSWIWDGNFEKLAQMDNIDTTFVAGIRVEDLTKRLMVAGFNTETLIKLDDPKAIVEAVKTAPTEKVYILATYTAMLNIRKELAESGYVKERMN
ncbi:Mur ligase family protein [Aerococcus sp. 1KP-2016]|uniref:Mur ligase family protein n=1 Tax=Aerococcus sp. 1KP-2016 TaxID=1981982 RepID=UPI000B99383A|nr:Mur ligase family protein [Aerococcus sp. 1KP-2016]OYQ67602.1 UDP-N-acetylmuramyl peptide synthase [Aerococcus sp. 1KP-2016]